MVIQKRNEKSRNWFSNSPILESKIVRNIMSGHKFGQVLRYLHCCDPNETGINKQGEHNPLHKVGEFMRSPESRWKDLFVPDQ